MWVGFFVVRGISDREIGSRGEGYARRITMEQYCTRTSVAQQHLREFHVIIHSIDSVTYQR